VSCVMCVSCVMSHGGTSCVMSLWDDMSLTVCLLLTLVGPILNIAGAVLASCFDMSHES
jgi:hypothetical protein